ncbi:MAG: hypothetical protein CBB68_02665 [Rhodospirillaceae bacterium TMED8]|nr:transcriptional regulator [Magnetovibrio sp.]OUT52277.1 MAG: hypothetical protein CBB68_02665 [Rhodospirillaceae bacterium TMED8]|tara:strand:+ start:514 stop:966 length:453 start_codon:yes stop_codon:yes gene_type:complete
MKDRHAESLGFLLNDLSQIMRKRFDRRARELELTRAQWRVLSRLRYRPGINQTTLAELLEVEPITLARHIDRLEEKAWVYRRSDPSDRRAWRLFLNESVQPVLDEMQKISEWNQDAALRYFNGTEREVLFTHLQRIKENLLKAEAADEEA